MLIKRAGKASLVSLLILAGAAASENETGAEEDTP